MKSLALFYLFCGAHGLPSSGFFSNLAIKKQETLWSVAHITLSSGVSLALLSQPSFRVYLPIILISMISIVIIQRPNALTTFLTPINIVTVVLPCLLLFSKLSIACMRSYIIFGAISLVLLLLSVKFKDRFQLIGSPQFLINQEKPYLIKELISSIVVLILAFLAHRYLYKYLYIINAAILIFAALMSFTKDEILNIVVQLINLACGIGIFIFQVRVLMGYTSAGFWCNMCGYLGLIFVTICFVDSISSLLMILLKDYFPNSISRPCQSGFAKRSSDANLDGLLKDCFANSISRPCQSGFAKRSSDAKCEPHLDGYTNARQKYLKLLESYDAGPEKNEQTKRNEEWPIFHEMRTCLNRAYNEIRPYLRSSMYPITGSLNITELMKDINAYTQSTLDISAFTKCGQLNFAITQVFKGDCVTLSEDLAKYENALNNFIKNKDDLIKEAKRIVAILIKEQLIANSVAPENDSIVITLKELKRAREIRIESKVLTDADKAGANLYSLAAGLVGHGSDAQAMMTALFKISPIESPFLEGFEEKLNIFISAAEHIREKVKSFASQP